MMCSAGAFCGGRKKAQGITPSVPCAFCVVASSLGEFSGASNGGLVSWPSMSARPKKRKATSAKTRSEVRSMDFEGVAQQISDRIRAVHMPYGTIMDPVFASPESDDIISYTRTGDS